MLNSLIVDFQERKQTRMKNLNKYIVFSLIVFTTSIAGTGTKQAPGFADISRPQDGEVLHGVVTIEGSAAHPAFISYELSFAYDPNPTDTWFPIVDDVQIPVTDGRLGLWDTSSITDGDYQLRLFVILENNSRLEAYARGLRVRNTTPTETQSAPEEPANTTPTPAVVIETPTPTVMPMVRIQNAGTQKVVNSLKVGSILGSMALLLFAAYSLMRKIVRTRRTSPRLRRSKATSQDNRLNSRNDR
jgi:hypothetical protein